MAIRCPKCDADNPETATFCADCGTKITSPEDIGVTKTIETPVEEYPRGSTFADRYKIIEKLGTGGMGAVYRVEDTNIGQDIALKLIKPDIASDKKTIERFRNELKTTRMISHRNVCRMFDLAETEGTHYITMEYISGEDLKSFIRRSGKLDIPKAISIAREICEGLSEAHRLGVVHRDLKSNNVMIDEEGNARIMDFGIAKSFKAKGLTGEGIIIGTPEYMSPEQAEAKQVDHRSDIYSLGVILYEMVTGELPFKGDTPLSIAMKHKGEIPKDPKELNPQIQEDFNILILNCLQKDKDNRYQNAGEFKSELERLEHGLPLTSGVEPKAKPLTSREITLQFSIKKLLIPSLVLICAIALALIIWNPLKQERPRPTSTDKPSVAVLYLTNSTGDRELDDWSQSLSNLLIDALSQSMYIDVLPKPRLLDILKKFGLLETDRYSSRDIENLVSYGVGNFIVWGDYYKSGENFRINLTLHNVETGKDLEPAQVEGSYNEIFVLVDELTEKLRNMLPLTRSEKADDFYVDIGRATTNSPEAYKYFSEGTKHYFFGNYPEGIPLLEKALEIDPDFVMAHRHLGAMISRTNRAKANEHWRRAYELRENAPERVRLLVESMYIYYVEGNLVKALERCQNLIKLYPEDIFGNRMLGIFYISLGEFENGLKAWQQNRRYFPESTIECTNYAEGLMNVGRYAEAAKELETYLEEFPDNTTVRSHLWRSYLFQEKYDLSLQVLEERFLLDPSRYRTLTYKNRGDIYLIKGDLEKAEKEYQQIDDLFRLSSLQLLRGRFQDSIDLLRKLIGMEKNERSLALYHLQLAYLYLKTGQPEMALSECEEASSIRRPSLVYKGRAFLDMESIGEAAKVTEELKNLWKANETNKHFEKHYKALLGLIELERGNYDKAAQHCSRAISLSALYRISPNNFVTYVEPLALAYYQMGDLDKAEKEYRKIRSLSELRLDNGDIYTKSFYMLGKIHEQQGNTAKAIENFEKFLTLWKDADPGIAEVDDAKKRLAGLKE